MHTPSTAEELKGLAMIWRPFFRGGVKGTVNSNAITMPMP